MSAERLRTLPYAHARLSAPPQPVHPGGARAPGTPTWHRAPRSPRRREGALPPPQAPLDGDHSDPRSAIWTWKKISKAKTVSPDY
ncbi:hypothetical protein NN561_017778 [Cricetulus griseus]